MTVTRDEFLHGLARIGVRRDDAERRWDAYVAKNARAAGIVLEPEDPAALEKVTQQKVTELFQAFGGVVRSTSQVRRSKVAPGLPDLWVCFPARGVALWWETKRPTGGVLSSSQQIFREDCRACGIACESGSRVDAEAWLIAMGWAVRVDAYTLEPTRAAAA